MQAGALSQPFDDVLSSYEDHNGVTTVSRDPAGRVVVQARGDWVGAHADAVIEGLGRAAAQSEELVQVYWDLAGVAHYESAVRKGLTRWLVANYEHLERHHYLVATNSLVAMGASTAGLALSVVGVRVHVTREPDKFIEWFERRGHGPE